MLLGLVLLVALVLFAPIRVPASVLRPLTLASGDWILADFRNDRQVSRFTTLARKSWALWIEHQLVLHLDRRHGDPTNGDDVERLLTEVGPLQRLFVSPDVVGASVSGSPAILRGVGYCDQINALAAHRLARSFPRAQAWALENPDTGISPHTIGRVWSGERNEWLYFDIFFDGVTVFRREGGRTEYLRRGSLLADPTASADRYPLEEWYGRMVDPGRVLVEYAPSFGGDLWLKRSSKFSPPSTARKRKERSSGERVATAPVSLEDSRVARSFLEARLTHLLEAERQALVGYQRTAALEPRNAEEEMLMSVARRFSVMLGEPEQR
ncbi:MAG TPA: hypothetical protein VM534_05915 [Thermoanaerobaculia bacterium]|nr:hypothetical protein [Thermoanaerobaculia bacterium]